MLGDPGIPKPNFTGTISTDAKVALADIQRQLAATTAKIKAEEASLTDAVRIADMAYNSAQQTLPAGDPSIADAKAKLESAAAAIGRSAAAGSKGVVTGIGGGA